MTQAGDDRFEYDLDGNMTLREEGDTAYAQQFDVENRLVAVTVTQGITPTVVRYGYDGDGNLAWREAGGEVELYIGEAVVVRGLSELPQPPPSTSHTIHLPLVARNASGSPPPAPSFQAMPFEGERYYRLGEAIVGWRVGSSAESVVYWLHADHLGSIVRVTDENGEQVLARGYDAWGEMAWATGTLTLTLPLGYTGQRFDEATGLLYLHARWYYPGLGRFVSADTIVPEPGNPQDFNRYSYAANSPLKYTDPSGHAVDPGGAWGAPWPPPPLTPTPPPQPVPTPPPSATPTPCEIQGCATDLSFNPFPSLGSLYDLRKLLLDASVEYRVPEVFNRLKMPNRAYMDTLPNGGVVMRGFRREAWSVEDSRILWRTAPSVVPVVGDLIGGGIVVGQNIYDYTRGDKQNAHPGEVYVSTGLDLMGYGTANLLGELAGWGAVGVGLAFGVSETGVGALVLYAGANLGTQVVVQEVWDAWATQPALEVFRESHPYP